MSVHEHERLRETVQGWMFYPRRVFLLVDQGPDTRVLSVSERLISSIEELFELLNDILVYNGATMVIMTLLPCTSATIGRFLVSGPSEDDPVVVNITLHGVGDRFVVVTRRLTLYY